MKIIVKPTVYYENNKEDFKVHKQLNILIHKEFRMSMN